MSTRGSTVGVRPPETDPDIEVGAVLGSYRLEDLVGSGAMGRVFRARHQLLNRTVAIKVLHPEYARREDVVQRFFQEARVVNEINHEHIVEVTDFVEERLGRAYCVMEYLKGRSLRDALKKRKKKKRLPLANFLRIMVQVCRALDAAHEKGVVHRDLKPDNIFLIDRGGEDYAKVLDFGVAKLNEPLDGAKAASTVAGVIIGTPIYMSPEQASGFDVDRRTDVWAAGVILYEILSGRVPFDADVFFELAGKILREPPPPLLEVTPRGEMVPSGLQDVVLKCLKKKPDDRYQTMADLANALEPFAGLGRKKVRRSALAVPLVVLALSGAVGYGAWRWPPARRIRDRLLGRMLPPETVPAPQHPVATPAPPPPPPAPVPAPPPRPSPNVQVEFVSKPKGATVTRTESGEVLGKTPLKLTLGREGGKRKFRFSLDGYQAEVASVDLSKDSSDATIDLRPVGHPPKPPETKPVHKKDHAGKKKKTSAASR